MSPQEMAWRGAQNPGASHQQGLRDPPGHPTHWTHGDREMREADGSQGAPRSISGRVWGLSPSSMPRGPVIYSLAEYVAPDGWAQFPEGLFIFGNWCSFHYNSHNVPSESLSRVPRGQPPPSPRSVADGRRWDESFVL